MRLEISSTLLDRLLTETAAAPDREICGLLFGTSTRIDAFEMCDNVAADPATGFEIDPMRLIAAYRAARNGGPEIVGCFHSHPLGKPVPSPRDAASAAPDGWLWLIVTDDEVAVWRAVAFGALHGRFDPVAWQAA